MPRIVAEKNCHRFPCITPNKSADTSTDVANCGVCGMACGPGFVCEGSCKWTPKALGSRLVLWLDAAKAVTVVGNKVSAWGDLSGQGNNAGQGTQSFQPTLENNAFGSRPGVAFNPNDGDNQYLLIPDATSLQFGIGDFMLLAVASWGARGEG